MILFLDTSALIKLYLTEVASEDVHNAVRRATNVAVARITWAEVHAAMARRTREVPDDERTIEAAREALARDWSHFLIVEITQAVVERAAEFADIFALRGYDSVQLACACELLTAATADTSFACFDTRLNKAARMVGLTLG